MSQDEGPRVLRHADQTRPLVLKHIDAKVVAATVVRHLGRTLAANIGLNQRGFLTGRRSLEHILEVDERARELTMRSQCEDDAHIDDPVLLAVDTSAAFPSLARPAINPAISASNMPTGAQHLARATMTGAPFRMAGFDTRQPRVPTTRGVTQGCPLAASLYVLTTEPIAKVMHSTIDAVDAAFVYAGDQALLLYSVDGPPQLNSIVNISKRALTLHINFKKSKLVSLAYDLNDLAEQCRRLSNRLAHLGGPWENLSIASHTNYLGYAVGPAAGTCTWDEPLSKWRQRSIRLADTTISPPITTRLYASRAVSVIDYAAAMNIPPKDIMRREQQVTAKLLRAPHCSYTRGLIHRWRKWGVPNIPMLSLHMHANRVITAARLAPLWRLATQRLRALQVEHISRASPHARLPVELAWSAPAFAFVLEHSLNDTLMHNDERVRKICADMRVTGVLDRAGLYDALLQASLTET